MGGVLFIIDISENELGLVSEVHHHFWFEFELMRMMMRVINGTLSVSGSLAEAKHLVQELLEQ